MAVKFAISKTFNKLRYVPFLIRHGGRSPYPFRLICRVLSFGKIPYAQMDPLPGIAQPAIQLGQGCPPQYSMIFAERHSRIGGRVLREESYGDQRAQTRAVFELPQRQRTSIEGNGGEVGTASQGQGRRAENRSPDLSSKFYWEDSWGRQAPNVKIDQAGWRSSVGRASDL